MAVKDTDLIVTNGITICNLSALGERPQAFVDERSFVRLVEMHWWPAKRQKNFLAPA